MADIDGLWQPSGAKLADYGMAMPPIVGEEPLWDIDGDGIAERLSVTTPAGLDGNHQNFAILRGGVAGTLNPEVLRVYSTNYGWDRTHLLLPEEHAMLVPSAPGSFAVVDLSEL